MIPFVLAYHSHNIAGTAYDTNDHVAFDSDLRTLTRAGVRIVPLAEIVSALREGRVGSDGPMVAGLTFDDGPVFDFADFDHPRAGRVRSFANIMHDFVREHGPAQPELHATSFVIASPEARGTLAAATECGHAEQGNWLGDDWWGAAVADGFLAIGSHSWDHVHHLVPDVCVASALRDDFTCVDNLADAELEVRRSAAWIRARSGTPCIHFAFPYGHASRYLVEDYLPRHEAKHGLEAAFGTGGRRVAADDSRWRIPRLVCGEHWTSPAQLEALIAAR